ncbi:MAG: exodeoxyribonuclease VII large subunit, partial [Victivallaceae bacterium]
MDEPVWSISEVNAAVRDLLEESLTPFWLTGEIGTMVIHRSGHVYLTLKDAQCQLKAAWFNGGKEAVNLGLETGVKIEAYGKLTAYPPRGEYQFSIRSVRLAGHGSLLMQFEKIR